MVLLNVTNKESGLEIVYQIEGDFEDIGKVKTAIHRLSGISEQFQLLVHGDSLLEDDNEILDYYDIFDVADIDVYRKLIPQFINMDVEWEGSTYNFHGSSESTVLELKEWFDRIGIAVPPDRQVLVYLGVELEEYKHLSDYVVDTNNDLWFMEIPPYPEMMMTVNVIVRSERLRAEFQVEERDTLYTLVAKARLEEIIDGRDCNIFSYETMQLTMKTTFRDHGIVNGDSLYVVYTE